MSRDLELELELELEREARGAIANPARRFAAPFANAGTGILRPYVVLDQFGFDQFALTRQHQVLIDRTAQVIVHRWRSGRPVRVVRIVGHTDSRGSLAYNQALGQRRALAVKNRLAAGIQRLQPGLTGQIQMTPGSLGSERPIAQSVTPQGRARNRRVEIFMLHRPSGTDCEGAYRACLAKASTTEARNHCKVRRLLCLAQSKSVAH